MVSGAADMRAGAAGLAAKAGSTKVVAVRATAATRARIREETVMMHSFKVIHDRRRLAFG
jgi:hypothetical protein